MKLSKTINALKQDMQEYVKLCEQVMLLKKKIKNLEIEGNLTINQLKEFKRHIKEQENLVKDLKCTLTPSYNNDKFKYKHVYDFYININELVDTLNSYSNIKWKFIKIKTKDTYDFIEDYESYPDHYTACVVLQANLEIQNGISIYELQQMEKGGEIAVCSIKREGYNYEHFDINFDIIKDVCLGVYKHIPGYNETIWHVLDQNYKRHLCQSIQKLESNIAYYTQEIQNHTNSIKASKDAIKQLKQKLIDEYSNEQEIERTH